MKHLIIILFLFGVFNSAHAQYNFFSVPDSLKENADYIVLEDYMEFKVLNPGEATEYIRLVLVVNNRFAGKYEDISILYNKNLKLSDLKAEILDVTGKRIKKLKGEDISDVSAVSGGSLYDDDRRKVLHFSNNRYPYIIFLEYTRTYKGILNYPSWNFQTDFNTSVVSSKLDFLIPEEMDFSYKEFNLNNPVKISEIDGYKKYSWEEHNLKAKKEQEMLPPVQYFMPMVLLAPKDFEMGNYQGSLKTWNDFGKWNYHLNKGRDELPLKTYTHVKELVKDAESDIEKAKILYEYMQNKTRYVSVQLGIGGYQTFPAEYVDENGYGDCKALTNYMFTLLEKVGVKSYYTLVRAGENQDDILTDFPSNQFNHVILCVPQGNDTVWLECTSQKQPFGFLGSFTDDRHVLLIDENGGKLVKTPEYGKDINKQLRRLNITVNSSGSAEMNMKTIFEGLFFENRAGIEEYSFEDQKKILYKFYNLSGMSLKSAHYDIQKKRIPSVSELIEMHVDKFASISSKRMFIKLNPFSGDTYIPPKNSNRKLPFEVKRAYMQTDSVTIHLPDEYQIESIPPEKHYESKFGTYSFNTVKINENTLLCVRKLIVEKGFFQAADYQKYYEYKKKIKRADKAKLVLVKK